MAPQNYILQGARVSVRCCEHSPVNEFYNSYTYLCVSFFEIMKEYF